MKRILGCLALVAIAYVAPLTIARAQTAEQLRTLGQWTSGFQSIIVDMIAPMQHVPDPPREDMNDAARRAWAEGARTWGRQTRDALVALDARANALGAPPDEGAPPALRQSLDEARLHLPEAIRVGQDFAAHYITLADAFENHQTGAARQIRAAAIDAVVLTMNLFHDINTSQAAAISSTHPQSSLLLCYARSYEGFAALMTFKRDVLLQGQSDRAATAARLEAAAEQMRTLIATGRASTRVMQQDFSDPSQVAPTEVALLPHLQGMLATYEGSFDREAALAAELQAVAVLLRDSRSFAAVEPSIDQHISVFGDLDTQRIGDAQRRQAFLTGP
jgi:hypothetical protein